MKPHISLKPYPYTPARWWCISPNCTGTGDTPANAYKAWMRGQMSMSNAHPLMQNFYGSGRELEVPDRGGRLLSLFGSWR